MWVRALAILGLVVAIGVERGVGLGLVLGRLQMQVPRFFLGWTFEWCYGHLGGVSLLSLPWSLRGEVRHDHNEGDFRFTARRAVTFDE